METLIPAIADNNKPGRTPWCPDLNISISVRNALTNSFFDLEQSASYQAMGTDVSDLFEPGWICTKVI
jgi:hypothetical protein